MNYELVDALVKIAAFLPAGASSSVTSTLLEEQTNRRDHRQVICQVPERSSPSPRPQQQRCHHVNQSTVEAHAAVPDGKRLAPRLGSSLGAVIEQPPSRAATDHHAERKSTHQVAKRIGWHAKNAAASHPAKNSVG